MTNPVEHEPIPKDIDRRTDEMVVPEYIEKAGVSPTQKQFNQRVMGDDGDDLVQSPATKSPVIEIPRTQEELEEISKGKSTEAKTWFGVYWFRMIKKAIHFKWKRVFNNTTVMGQPVQMGTVPNATDDATDDAKPGGATG